MIVDGIPVLLSYHRKSSGCEFFVPARTHKLTESHTIVHYNFVLVYLYIMAGGLTMVMDAIVATVVDGGRAIVDIDIEAGRNKLIYHLLYNFTLNPSTAASSNPF